MGGSDPNAEVIDDICVDKRRDRFDYDVADVSIYVDVIANMHYRRDHAGSRRRVRKRRGNHRGKRAQPAHTPLKWRMPTPADFASDRGRQLLTLTQVARELRCSKAHVSNLIGRRVRHAAPLPVVQLGRRKLVRREALDAWIRANERAGVRDKLPALSEVDVVRRIRGGI